jgi:hypothetical protein
MHHGYSFVFVYLIVLALKKSIKSFLTHSPFDLGRGEAQGNTPSPLLYNMGEQILLFKLELSPEICSVFVHFLIPRPALNQDRADPTAAPAALEMRVGDGTEPVPVEEDLHPTPKQEFVNESNRETDNSEAFADDTSVFTEFSLLSLSALKNCMEDFGKFSGLKCNIEKTVLMQVGNKIPVSDKIKNLGFAMADSIKILGMEIDSEISNLDSNFDRIAVSIDKSISFWERFNLTLPGRINVAKSLLLSLVNYLGCFIMPSRTNLNHFQQSIDSFTVGKLNVARNRITQPVECGGAGHVQNR